MGTDTIISCKCQFRNFWANIALVYSLFFNEFLQKTPHQTCVRMHQIHSVFKIFFLGAITPESPRGIRLFVARLGNTRIKSTLSPPKKNNGSAHDIIFPTCSSICFRYGHQLSADKCANFSAWFTTAVKSHLDCVKKREETRDCGKQSETEYGRQPCKYTSSLIFQVQVNDVRNLILLIHCVV